MSRRFAVYYAPPPGSALEAFGRAWLGRDHTTGAALPQPRIEGLAPDRLSEITRFPRHYGFHGTLKAPFALAHGRSGGAVHRAAASLASARAPFACAPLQVNVLSGFLALTPAAACPGLEGLAADCVRTFEPFRAPLPEAEIRRRRSGLTPRQEAHLLELGYPYVFEEFRFHMTVTGQLEEPERGRVLAILRARAEAVTSTPLRIDAIAIYEQEDRDQPFLMTARYPLGGGV